MILRVVLLLVALCAGAAGPAAAHALDPGYLQVDALGQDSYAVLWREPDVDGRPMGLNAVLPETCAPAQDEARRPEARGWVVRWVAECPGGIAGGTVRIDGLSATNTDVLIRVQALEGGAVQTHRATPGAPSVVLPVDPSAWSVLASYGALGVEHILTGWDHLCFVLGLMLLVHGTRRLIAVITSFTLAHSVTLAATALGWLSLPGPPVEAVIALSIAFLAAESIRYARTGRDTLSTRAPWIVAFGFGLLHGLGFGGALKEIGLPQSDLVLALLSFNVGVEVGQLIFVALVLAVWQVLARLGGPVDRLRPVAAYGIGAVAIFWTLERLAGFVT